MPASGAVEPTTLCTATKYAAAFVGWQREWRTNARICLCYDYGDGCHELIERMNAKDGILCGLAIIKVMRHEDYNLRAFTALACPQAPQRYTDEEVERWITRLCVGGPR